MDKKSYDNKYKNWNKEDKATVIAMFKAGISIQDIAKDAKRQITSVRNLILNETKGHLTLQAYDGLTLYWHTIDNYCTMRQNGIVRNKQADMVTKTLEPIINSMYEQLIEKFRETTLESSIQESYKEFHDEAIYEARVEKGAKDIKEKLKI